jgi:Zn-dependent peptidase ImmA (M78 family)
VNKLENIEDQVHSLGLDLIHTNELPNRIKAITYCDDESNLIFINQNIESACEKACILAEELGHYCTSSGELLSGICPLNVVKQEEIARRWADDFLLSPMAIATAIRKGCMCEDDLVEHFGVTHEYLNDAIKRHYCRHGEYFKVDQVTVLIFRPLGLLSMLKF